MNFEELINQTPRERIWNLFERLESESGLAKILKRSDTELTDPENIEALESLAISLGSFALAVLAQLKAIGEEKETKDE